MAIKQRIEKLEEQPEYKQPDLLVVVPLEDGTYKKLGGESVYTRADLDAFTGRLVIWNSYRPKNDAKAVG